ncbi:MAG TPA: hypothetical protein PLM49_02850 [Bacteroidales bacterium]|nr:hypothetical protein [Bacteroidales bacterium]
MKKIMYLFFAVALGAAIVSCGNKKDSKDCDKDEVAKIENFADLQKKYDGKTFDNCDEFFAAAEEMIDVRTILAKKYEGGDKQAKQDLIDLIAFMQQFDSEAERFEAECPEKMNEFNERIQEKNKPVENTLKMLAFEVTDTDDIDAIQALDEAAEEVDNKLESLKSDNSDALNKLKNN